MQTRSSSSAKHRPHSRFRGKVLPDRTVVVSGPRSSSSTKRRSFEYASKDFRLPRGWTAYEIPRKSSYIIDKYYVERKTGKRFRSFVSVERYLKESKNHTYVTPKDEKLTPSSHHHHDHSKDFSLPDGWITEHKPRRDARRVDKYYIEPGTGRKFHSLPSVERYLQEVGKSRVDSVSMVHPERLSLLLMNRKDEFTDPKPPKKIKWVLTGPSGNMFTANVSGSDVSGLVRQTWSEAFVSLIQDR
ncbi:unnamed protein product [Cochlearia groenlandica]